jgi:hypothetical protein
LTQKQFCATDVKPVVGDDEEQGDGGQERQTESGLEACRNAGARPSGRRQKSDSKQQQKRQYNVTENC